MDQEMIIMRRMCAALSKLDKATAQRILRWLGEKVESLHPTTEPKAPVAQ